MLSGTESGIRQNIEPICEMLKTALESPSWTVKAQVSTTSGKSSFMTVLFIRQLMQWRL